MHLARGLETLNLKVLRIEIAGTDRAERAAEVHRDPVTRLARD